jgi:hypothetical protein
MLFYKFTLVKIISITIYKKDMCFWDNFFTISILSFKNCHLLKNNTVLLFSVEFLDLILLTLLRTEKI